MGFYFGSGFKGEGGSIMAAYSTDLVHWERDPQPLYRAGGHPAGLDASYAHKVAPLTPPRSTPSVLRTLALTSPHHRKVWPVFKDGVGYLFYVAVGPYGRGIALLTSKPLGQA